MPGRRIVECVPNFSEGRDEAIAGEILGAIESVPAIALLDRTMDADHNRCVITFAGDPDAVVEAAVRGAATASRLIDLNSHTGVHPRIGATDVIPFVPLENVSLEECASLAVQAGQQIWERLGIPVYLYEAAARAPDRRRLENIRRGTLLPDFGGPEPHPTAGATAVGARKILIAYNVNLATNDIGIARAIARAIRESSGGFPCVKALGLPLLSRGQVQVSMNLTDYERTPMHVVYDAICREARKRDVEIAGTEIIGLVPGEALEDAAAHYLKLENIARETVLETRLQRAWERSVSRSHDPLI